MKTFDVDGFKAFVVAQAPDRTYTSSSCHLCALGQYAMSIGWYPNNTGMSRSLGQSIDYPRDVFFAFIPIVRDGGWNTWGALSARLAEIGG